MRLSKALNLAASLCVLSHSGIVDARPATNIGFVSIPIYRVPSSGAAANLPPTIVHQQHSNRGIRRRELMTGARETPDHELFTKIQKRASTIAPHLQKRYNHAGIAEILSHLALTDDTADAGGKPGAFKAAAQNGSEPVVFETTPFKGIVTPAKKPTFPHTLGLDIQAKDVGYLAKFQIGTPPRDFVLLMDSGSADLWVGAENCVDISDVDAECAENHTYLGSNSSSTFNDTKQEWAIQYGTGAVSGTLVHDHVRIAGLHLKDFRFGVAVNETSDFTPEYIPFDGLAGFAKSLISRQRTTTLVETLKSRNLIKHAITSYKISRVADKKNDGELTLGAMNPDKYDPDTLVSVPNVNALGFWETRLSGVKVGGKDMGWKNRTAIFDTGTTLIIAPQADVDAIHKHIPGAASDGDGYWTVPCTTKAVVSLTIGGREFSIDPRDLVFLPIDPDKPMGNCTSGFSSGSIGGETEWLVGDTFLKNVYMSTNVETDEISFAKLT